MASLPIAAVGVHCDGCLPYKRAVFPARSHGLARHILAPCGRSGVSVCQAGPFRILP